MTNKEALQNMLPVGLQDNLVEKVLMDSDINGDEIYTSDNEKDVDMVYVELLNYVITQSTLTDGSLDVARGRCINEKRRILKKYGMDTTNISDGTNRW